MSKPSPAGSEIRSSRVAAITAFGVWAILSGAVMMFLAALAQYSAGGAVWYLLTALWLSRNARPREA